MKIETIVGMHCPACGFGLKIEQSFEVQDGEVLYGIVSCECSEYPILEGILVLRSDTLTHSTLRLLRKTVLLGALLHFLIWDIRSYAYLSIFLFRKNKTAFILNLLHSTKTMSKLVLLLETNKLSFRQLIKKM